MSNRFKRILVLGSPGSGKTWLSNKLGKITGIEVIHMDDYYWGKNWEAMPDDLWNSQLKELLNKPSYILDGNYGDTIPYRLAYSDCAIFINRSLPGCIVGFTRRCLVNLLRNGCELPVQVQAGCRKAITDEGYFKFVTYIIKFHMKKKREILSYLKLFPDTLLIKRSGEWKKVVDFLQN